MFKHKSYFLLIGLILASSLQAQTEPQNLKDPTQSAKSSTTPGAYVSPDDYYWSSNTAKETTSRVPIQTTNIKDLNDLMAENLSQTVDKNAVPTDKAKQIEDSAYAFGLQSGLARGTLNINNTLTAKQVYYDQAFNFSALELEPGMLPPVISEGRNAYRADNDNVVRVATRIYRIEFPARLVATPPRWQDYLISDVSAPAELSKDALPKTKGEKAVWDTAVAKGWNDGLAQAKDNYEDNLGRLQRDMNGMIRYRDLYQQGLVQKPILARTPLGTTGGGDEMALSDQVIEITKKAALDPNSKRWSTTSNPVTASQDH